MIIITTTTFVWYEGIGGIWKNNNKKKPCNELSKKYHKETMRYITTTTSMEWCRWRQFSVTANNYTIHTMTIVYWTSILIDIFFLIRVRSSITRYKLFFIIIIVIIITILLSLLFPLDRWSRVVPFLYFFITDEWFGNGEYTYCTYHRIYILTISA